MYYNARYYDPAIGQFISPDTIVPDPSNVLDYNRYMYVRGNPLKYNDPSGHFTQGEVESYLQGNYPDQWESYLAAWQSDDIFWAMLMVAQIGDVLFAPTSPSLGHGDFISASNAAFGFSSHQGDKLYEYQGYGPYRLTDVQGEDRLQIEKEFTYSAIGMIGNGWLWGKPSWQQPLYRYGDGGPQQTGFARQVSYQYDHFGFNPLAGDDLPWLPGAIGAASFGATTVLVLCPQCSVAAIGTTWAVAGGTTALNNMASFHHVMTVDLVNVGPWISAGPCPYNACMSAAPDTGGLLR